MDQYVPGANMAKCELRILSFNQLRPHDNKVE